MDFSERVQTDEIYRRVGHVTVPYMHYVVVWGGFVGEKVNSVSVVSSYCPPDDVWFYNCLTDIWSLRRSFGEIPPGNLGSIAVIHENELYIFGGLEQSGDGGWSYSNNLYLLNLCTLTWSKIVGTGRPPQGCDKSVGWYYKKKLYFFGGYGTRPIDPPFDYDYMIDCSEENRGWNNQFVCFDLITSSWMRPKTRGVPPTPRAAHTAAITGDFVYVFGGRVGGVRNNEMYCMDMTTLTWSENLTEGVVPTGRSWHTFNFVSPNKAALYGGLSRYGMPAMDFWECTIDEKRNINWTLRQIYTEPLCWHQAAYCSVTGDLVIVGGVSTSPYVMGIEDHVDVLTIIHYKPKSLFRLCMDSIVENNFLKIAPNFFETNFPKALLHLLQIRSSVNNNNYPNEL